MTCQRSLTHSEEERKDGVLKKYDPKKEREKMEMERESVKKKGAFIHLVHWSDQLVNMSIFSLWIQSLILQQK